jgi:hypothetical protein
MRARQIAWIDIASAIGITVLVPFCVETLGWSPSAYGLVVLAWVGTAVVVPILFRVDRRHREAEREVKVR